MKFLFLALSLGLMGCTSPVFDDASSSVSSSSAASSIITYDTQTHCETATGKTCDYVMCDYIPEGKTFEETCGKDFQEGWIPVN